MTEPTSTFPVCCNDCGKLVLEAEIEAGKPFSFLEIARGHFVAPFSVKPDLKTIVCRDCDGEWKE